MNNTIYNDGQTQRHESAIYARHQLVDVERNEDISDDEESIEEVWDDMAILKAFDHALKKENGTNDSTSVGTSICNTKKKNNRPEDKPKTTTAVSSAAHDHQTEGPSSPVAIREERESIYAAAYAAAVSHLQQQSPYTPHQFSPPAPTPSHFQQQSPANPHNMNPYSFAPTAPTPSHFQQQSPANPHLFSPTAPGSSDLSQLLYSWYYSGYCTGRYKALQETFPSTNNTTPGPQFTPPPPPPSQNQFNSRTPFM